MPRLTGTTLSHYRVLDWLGEGATAAVYRAEDLSLGRPVALKLLPPTLTTDLGTIARFQHEARTASSLSHPNICTIYEIDQHDGRHFIAMEFLEGRSLAAVINGRPIEPYRLIELAIQIADGLEAAHEARVIHRDLKPANIYVTHRDHVKLLDFGLATLLPFGNSGRTASSATWLSEPGGTGPYMSPEQTLAEPLDTRSDLFTFGVVLYEMATGARPFAGVSHAALIDAIRSERQFPARDLNTAVPEELDRIINKALEKNRKLRYQTASDISADLRRLKRDLDASELPVSRPAPAATPLEPAPVAAPAPAPTSRRSFSAVRPAQLISAAALGGCLVAVGLPLLLKGGSTSSARPRADARPDVAAPWEHSAATAAASAEATSVETEASPTKPAPLPVPSQPPATAPSAGAVAPAPLASLPEQLRVAERREALGLYDAAIETLDEAIKADPTSSAAPVAYLRMAALHEKRGDLNRAIAAYADLATRYPDDSRAPEALYAVAGALLRTKRADRDTEARRTYGDVATRYPRSPWAARALMGRADIEERRRLKEIDPVLGRMVPAALVSYRQVINAHPQSAEREHALWRAAHIYIDLKHFDLAASALEELGTRYSANTYESWFLAGELYEKRLHDLSRARSAFARVPPSSARWRDAQKRLGAAK